MPDNIEIPKILKPNQVDVPLKPQIIPLPGNFQMQIQTPEGRLIVVLIQIVDYNWEKNQVYINAGQIDVTEAAKQGKFGMPTKGPIIIP